MAAVLEQAGGVVVRRFYSMTFEIIRKKTIDSIERGDIELDQLRISLMSDFEELKECINILRSAPLKNAHKNLILAYTAIEFNKQSEVVHHFREVQRNANDAFEVDPTFEGKVMATKFLLLAMLYLNNFMEADENQMKFIGTQCHNIFNSLLETTEVACALQTNGGIMSSVFGMSAKTASIRKNIHSDLRAIRQFIHKHTGKYCAILNDQKKEISFFQDTAQLALLPAATEGATAKGICMMEMVGNRLFTSDEAFNVYVYDALSDGRFEKAGEFGCSARIWNVLVDNNTAYLMSGGALERWDLKTFKFISYLEMRDFTNKKLFSYEDKKKILVFGFDQTKLEPSFRLCDLATEEQHELFVPNLTETTIYHNDHFLILNTTKRTITKTQSTLKGFRELQTVPLPGNSYDIFGYKNRFYVTQENHSVVMFDFDSMAQVRRLGLKFQQSSTAIFSQGPTQVLLLIENNDFIFAAKYIEALSKFEIVMFHYDTLEIVGRVIHEATSDFNTSKFFASSLYLFVWQKEEKLLVWDFADLVLVAAQKEAGKMNTSTVALLIEGGTDTDITTAAACDGAEEEEDDLGEVTIVEHDVFGFDAEDLRLKEVPVESSDPFESVKMVGNLLQSVLKIGPKDGW